MWNERVLSSLMALAGSAERRSGCRWRSVDAEYAALSEMLGCAVRDERERYCEGGVHREARRPDALNGAPGASLGICRAEFMILYTPDRPRQK